MSKQRDGLTRAVVTADDEMARARRHHVWALVLLVGAVLAGHALWEWYISSGDLLREQPIPG